MSAIIEKFNQLKDHNSASPITKELFLFLEELFQVPENKLEQELISIYKQYYPKDSFFWNYFEQSNLLDKLKMVIKEILDHTYKTASHSDVSNTLLKEIILLHIELHFSIKYSIGYDLYTYNFGTKDDSHLFYNYLKKIIQIKHTSLMDHFLSDETHHKKNKETNEIITIANYLQKVGTDPELAEDILKAKKSSILETNRLEHWIIKSFITHLLDWSNPKFIEEQIDSQISELLEFNKFSDLYISKFVSYSKKSQKQGLLSLEDDLEQIKEESLRKSLQLIIDGTDPEIVREILERDNIADIEKISVKANLMISGILSIQAGDNPRIVEEKLSAYIKDNETKKLTALFYNLSEKARREGLLALEDDVNIIEEPMFQKGLQLVIDGTDPELIKEFLNTYKNFQLGLGILFSEIFIGGIVGIQQGIEPDLLEAKLLAYPISKKEILRLKDLKEEILLIFKKIKSQGYIEAKSLHPSIDQEYPALSLALHLIGECVEKTKVLSSLDFLFKIDDLSVQLSSSQIQEFTKISIRDNFPSFLAINDTLNDSFPLSVSYTPEFIDSAKQFLESNLFRNIDKDYQPILEKSLEDSFPQYFDSFIKKLVVVEEYKLNFESQKENKLHNLLQKEESSQTELEKHRVDILQSYLNYKINRKWKRGFDWNTVLNAMLKDAKSNPDFFVYVLTSIFYRSSPLSQLLFFASLVPLNKSDLDLILLPLPEKLRFRILCSISKNKLDDSDVHIAQGAFSYLLYFLKEEYDCRIFLDLEYDDVTDSDLEEFNKNFSKTILSLKKLDIQKVFREIDSADLACVLYIASEKVSKKIYSAMSKRAASFLKEDVSSIKPKNISIADSIERILMIIDKIN